MAEIQSLFVASAAVADGTRGPRAKWMLVAWLAVLAICVGGSLAWTLTRSPATRESIPSSLGVSQAQFEQTQPALSQGFKGAATNRGQAIVVVLPAEHDYLTSLTIPVAGFATGRPHGPRVREVHATVTVNGRVVGRADLPVYSGRFAGTIEIVAGVQGGTAELSVANPDRPGKPPAIRRFTLATATD